MEREFKNHYQKIGDKKAHRRGMGIELSELKENVNTYVPHANIHEREILAEKHNNNQVDQMIDPMKWTKSRENEDFNSSNKIDVS